MKNAQPLATTGSSAPSGIPNPASFEFTWQFLTGELLLTIMHPLKGPTYLLISMGSRIRKHTEASYHIDIGLWYMTSF